MGFSKSKFCSIIFFSLFVFSHFITPIVAAPKKSYVVLLGSHSHGSEISEADLQRVTNSHYKLLGSFLGSTKKAKDAIFYSYKKHINGFAAILEEKEATELAKHPEVASVLPNKASELYTTHSWDFMKLGNKGEKVPDSSLWKKARYGEDAIIATLDGGVWPESKSFSDEGINGPIPSRWKGSCEDSSIDGFKCNRKLIGGKFFNKGLQSYLRTGNMPYDISSFKNTTRDYAGHGTHTLSTLGGNFVSGKDVFGSTGFGSAKGGSPKARVAAYKVCWPFEHGGCFMADIVSGFDEAIHDGVDVLSLSLGGGPGHYYNDGIAIAAFHAIKRNITVVCAAGNSGPTPGTADNIAPWILTVGASTLDRRFQATVRLGNGQTFTGSSLSKSLPEEKQYPLISGEQARYSNVYPNDAMFCLPNSLDPERVKGKILVCLRGGSSKIDKGKQASLAGAAGMILCNDQNSDQDITPDLHVLPASHISYVDGYYLFSYLDYTQNPTAYLEPPTEEVDIKPAPTMATFSSRGPSIITPEIIKPDVTAPGVDIIAAYTEAKSKSPNGEKVPYITMSGTSMATPHVSGIVGLLKTLHPDWSPAAIKSALMTTGRVRDNTMHTMFDSGSVSVGAFSYGSGHVQPNDAADPGLVYDLTPNDYLDFLCAIGYNQNMLRAFTDEYYECPASASLLNFNYPSIAVQNFYGRVTVTRKLKNAGSPGVYRATVSEPAGISVTVEPSELKFDKIGEEKSFTLRMYGYPYNYVVDGTLVWSDGTHNVRSPIVVSAGSF